MCRSAPASCSSSPAYPVSWPRSKIPEDPLSTSALAEIAASTSKVQLDLSHPCHRAAKQAYPLDISMRECEEEVHLGASSL